jgi:cystathionine beta-lyase/cystathionine gamma-synthase
MPEDQQPPLHPETRAITEGRADQHGSLAPLLWPSTTYETGSADEAAALAKSVDPDRFYARHGNPGVRAFEEAVASLEGAEAARAYASGMGAVTGVILGICSSGDHIVAQRQLYSQTTSVLLGICPRFGIDVTLVDGTEPGAFAAAVQPGKTTLVFAETPANPRLDLVDLDEIGAIKGPVTCVDSTFATPLGQQPLAHGADLVLHSATKGIAGHNDASLGIVCGSQELVDWLWGFAVFQGANASPFDAMNGLRGLRTLGVRLARQTATAQELAERLEASPHVEAVRYPGLDSHPQRDLAKRQLAHNGSILAFDVVGGRPAGQAFVEALQVARMATSLGGPETIVSHPASTTHQSLLPEELEAVGIGPGTIRLSVGLEHVDDVVADVLQALDVASKVS